MKTGSAAALAIILFTLATAASADTDKINQAQQAFNAGQSRQAIVQLKDVLQLDPENIEARFLLGEIYLKSGDPASAEKELRRAALLDDELTRIAPLLLEAMLAQAKFDAIDQYLQSNSSEDPLLKSVFNVYEGFVALSRKQYQQAEAFFHEALATDPANAKAVLGLAGSKLTQSDSPAALKILTNHLKQTPDDVKALALRAAIFQQQGKSQQAEQDFLAILKIKPADYKARLGMVLLKVRQKKAAEALAHIGKLPENFKHSPIVDYMTAVALYIQNDLDKAEKHLQDVLKRVPDHLQSRLLLGIINYSKNNWQLAEDHFRPVSKRLPNNSNIAALLAATYLKLEKPEQAIKLLEKLIADTNLQNVQIFSLLGSAYLQKGDNNKSQQWLNKAVSLAPDQAEVRTQLALGLLAGGDTNSAISALESAVDLGQDLIQTDILLIMSHLKAGDSKKAISVSKLLQEKYPDNPIVLNLAGLSHFADEQYETADELFIKAIKQDPDFSVATLNRARIKLATNDLAGAKKHFKTVLEQQPEDLTALLGLSQIAGHEKNRKQQVGYLERIVKIEPQHSLAVLQLAELYLRMDQPSKSLELLSRIPAEKLAEPAYLRIRGMAQISARQAGAAIETLSQLVNKAPDNVESNFQLGRAYLLNNDMQKANESFNTTAKLDKSLNHPVVWLALAETSLKLKDFKQVLSVTDRLLGKPLETAAIYELRAAAFEGLGKIDDVGNALSQSYQLEPTSRRANMLANYYNKNKQTEVAIKVLSDWLHKNPEDAVTHSILGLTYQQQGRYDLAIESYERSLKHNPDDAITMNNLAWLYHKQGDKRAVSLAKQAYEKSQKHAEIIDTYGWILFETGKTHKALPILQQALLLKPSHPEIAYHVAAALKKLNRMDEAKTIIERIQKNHPTSSFAEKANQLLTVQ